MEDLVYKIQALLEEHFPGCKVDLEFESGVRIGGEILWSGFDGMDQLDRQTALWSVLRENLSEDERGMLRHSQ